MKKSKKKPEAKPQHIEKLSIKLDAPMKMHSDLEMKAICVMVGANDSGKSFLLKVAYALGTTSQAVTHGPGPAVDSAQFIFDNTFVDNNLDGTVEAVFTKGSILVSLVKGKVVNVESKELVNPAPMIFMSSDLRTFDSMNVYLRMRHEAGADGVIFMKKMLGAYRLYDFTYMEALIFRCPVVIPKSLMETLKSTYNFKETIASLDIDQENHQFVAILEDGTKKNLATYGKGHQAILNMMIGAST